MTTVKLPVTYLAQIESYLTSQGLDSEDWLQDKGLNTSALKIPDKTIDYDDYSSLIASAAKMDGHQNVGLRIGHHLRVNQHGALGFALLSSGSLKESLYLLSRYIKTRTPLIDVTVTDHRERTSLRFEELYDFSEIKVWFMEALVVTLCNIFRFICPSEQVIELIKMPISAPVYSEDYPDYIPCHVEFGHDVLEIQFSPGAMELDLNGDTVALEQAKTICESEIERWEKGSSIADQVRKILSVDCGLTLLQVADELHLTGRTLHRKLQKEHHSFHRIQDEVRHFLAKQYLGQEQLSVKEVAYSLGYSDVANFRRAFKRLEGCSPITFRRSGLKQGN